MSTNKKSFIDCLDSFKEKPELNYYDILNVLNLSNIHYLENKYYQPEYTGISMPYHIPPSKIKSNSKKTIHQDPSHDPLYYSVLSQSNWNTMVNNIDNDSKDDYELWQKKHEINIQIPVVPKQKITIDASVNNLGDLIDIIEKNKYSEENEYNIDLKSLSEIKPELEKLNNMIGMQELKTSILNQLLYFMQELHITNKESDFKHTVLYGPPGTGKTEIAKVIGLMYSKLGILKNNVFKKVTRNDLVAGYLGQTAIKTKKIIDECLGGVLFIDEAYALANNYEEDSYSKECIDTLCEALSDHKDDLMVIIAGYEEDLNNSFFKANKGMESRFIWRFNINNYNSKELMDIFKKKIHDTDWTFDNENDITEKWFEKNKREFKNYGRDMELLFSYLKVAHSRRIYGKDNSLRKKITIEDLQNGYELFMKNKKPEGKMREILSSIYV
jgi:SpoVK/Ycf46/Vps4 family AAA+-type ATPase